MGAATAHLLAAHGARFALLARRADRLETLAKEFACDGGQVLAVTANLTEETTVQSAAEWIRDGRVDVVVNAAGVMLLNPVDAGRIDEWTRMVDTNITGALRMINAFRDDLLEPAARSSNGRRRRVANPVKPVPRRGERKSTH